MLQITVAKYDSCSVSRNIYKKVERCPETKHERDEAAARMNCSAHASHCSEPYRFTYHCVLDPSGGLVEVCAYIQNIIYGR